MRITGGLDATDVLRIIQLIEVEKKYWFDIGAHSQKLHKRQAAARKFVSEKPNMRGQGQVDDL